MQININETEKFPVSDLGLVTYLSLKFPYTNKISESKVVFYFSNDAKVLKEIDNYWKNIALVKAKDFSNQLKTIKSIIHSQLC